MISEDDMKPALPKAPAHGDVRPHLKTRRLNMAGKTAFGGGPLAFGDTLDSQAPPSNALGSK